MNTTITASCPYHGVVKLKTSEVCLETEWPGEDPAMYTFICPADNEKIAKPADERIICLLSAVVKTVCSKGPHVDKFVERIHKSNSTEIFQALFRLANPGEGVYYLKPKIE